MNNIFLEEPPQGMYNHEALYYMAKSIDVMGKVDAVYFTKDWATARGCKIEREIAKAYGVKILNYDFLEEPKDELVRLNVDYPKIPNLSDWDRGIVDPYKLTCSE